MGIRKNYIIKITPSVNTDVENGVNYSTIEIEYMGKIRQSSHPTEHIMDALFNSTHFIPLHDPHI